MVSWKDSDARLELMSEWESIKGDLIYAKEYANDVFWGAMPEKVQKDRKRAHPEYDPVKATKRSGMVEVVMGAAGAFLPYAPIALAVVGTLAMFSGLNRYEEAGRKGDVNGSIFVAGPYKAYDGSLLSRKS